MDLNPSPQFENNPETLLPRKLRVYAGQMWQTPEWDLDLFPSAYIACV